MWLSQQCKQPDASILAALAIGLSVWCGQGTAHAQSISVVPVNVVMPPGQMATTLTILNQGDSETSIQVRMLGWSQTDGHEHLTSSDDIVASPPIATVAAGGSQVIRLVLRRPAQDKEATYRILVDQIPPAAAAGTIRIALRLSIPVFAEPPTRAVPQVHYHVELAQGQAYLVASNEGERHDKLGNVVLTASSGKTLQLAADASPYVLAGATTRRRLVSSRGLPARGEVVRLHGVSDAGPLDETIAVSTGP